MKKARNQQNKFFEQKRREGIYAFNVRALTMNEKPSMRERQPKFEDDIRVCNECKCFLSNRYFSKHKCTSETPEPIKPKLLASNSAQLSRDPEFASILNRFRDGEVGDLCRTDNIIKQIGYRHFNLRRFDISKQDEVRKVVMGEMRELARLFVAFKALVSTETVSVEKMFSRQHLPELREAIEKLVSVENSADSEKKEKHGLKLMLDAIILRSIKALSGYYSETMQDEKFKEMKMFKTAYQYRSNEIYSSARHQCVKNSMQKSRRPENLPLEWDIKQINSYLNSEITHTVKNFSVENYAWLRSLIVTRLTLYNARRGEEPSRMLVKELKDALTGTWIPADSIESVQDDGEKFLLGQFKLAYIGGKGRKFVPVLVPNDLVPGLTLLLEHRKSYGITDENQFVFATKASSSHCSGWHALKEVCDKVGVNVAVTATKNRHRLSTLYASLDMKAQDRSVFLEHMGHAEKINKENYQCPMGVKEVCVMGKVLNTVDSFKAGSNGEDCTQQNEMEQNTGTACSDPTQHDQDVELNIDTGCLLNTDTESDDSSLLTTNMTNEKQGLDYGGNGSNSVRWSKEDTSRIRSYFQTWVEKDHHDNKGNLPSKDQIMAYLKDCQPQSVKDLTIQEQYIKTRTKLFNERKTLRMKARGELKKITVVKKKFTQERKY